MTLAGWAALLDVMLMLFLAAMVLLREAITTPNPGMLCLGYRRRAIVTLSGSATTVDLYARRADTGTTTRMVEIIAGQGGVVAECKVEQGHEARRRWTGKPGYSALG